jgi:hypothetical protein
LQVNAPICENELASTSFTASIKDVVNIPNGAYTVTYTVSGNTNVFQQLKTLPITFYISFSSK